VRPPDLVKRDFTAQAPDLLSTLANTHCQPLLSQGVATTT